MMPASAFTRSYHHTEQGNSGMPWIEAAAAKWGWIWIGLTFGLFAKYALLIKKGVRIRAILVIADLMLLPMVALIAYYLSQKVGLENEASALLTALAAVGADRVVKLYTDRFFRGVDALMAEEAARRRGEIREEVQMEMSELRNLKDLATGKRPIDD